MLPGGKRGVRVSRTMPTGQALVTWCWGSVAVPESFNVFGEPGAMPQSLKFH
jgi:hypothetical protein